MCLNKLFKLLELGYARSYWIDLFAKGIISSDEMFQRLDKIDRKLKK